jgi:glucose 1-dehydrogenase
MPISSKSDVESFQPRITPVPDRLKGKTALVTGSGRGIGRAIAERLALEGANVVVNDKELKPAQDVVYRLTEFGAQALAVEADISDRRCVEELFAAIERHFGELDILVNNAGIIVFGSLLDCRIEDWDRMMAVDLKGPFHCTQIAAKLMLRQGRGGRLIHIGSTGSLLPAPEQAAYCIAKAGLRMLSRIAALELASSGITSNLLCPQGAVTDINRDLLSDPEMMAKLEAALPMGRLARVEEIAAAVAFLASDEAAYISGAELLHDGAASISALWWR